MPTMPTCSGSCLANIGMCNSINLSLVRGIGVRLGSLVVMKVMLVVVVRLNGLQLGKW